MTLRTPIRLTPHRGPLATPSTSPESSPTLSTPHSDISYSTNITPTLDVAVLQHRFSTLSLPTQHQFQSLLYSQGFEVIDQGLLFGFKTCRCPLILTFESWLHSAYNLAKILAGIVSFCLLMWGFLEWSSYASEVQQVPHPCASLPRLPLPSLTGEPHFHSTLSPPGEQHVAVLQFLAGQIEHAKALSSLSASLGLPLRAFFDSHRASILRVVIPYDLPERPHHIQEVDILANLTEFLDPSLSLLDFTSGSFVGRSFALALDELGDLISEPVVPVLHGSATHGNHQDAHLYAIYWRTTSNLLLEYSAARPRARRLLHRLHTLHRQLSPLIDHADGGTGEIPRMSWWKDVIRQSTTSIQDEVWAVMTGLEIMLDNARRLIAYLDWITDQLAQATLEDVLKLQYETDFSTCMMALQELFAHAKPSTPRRIRLCFDGFGATLPQPQRVKIMVPGSPTVR